MLRVRNGGNSFAQKVWAERASQQRPCSSSAATYSGSESHWTIGCFVSSVKVRPGVTGCGGQRPGDATEEQICLRVISSWIQRKLSLVQGTFQVFISILLLRHRLSQPPSAHVDLSHVCEIQCIAATGRGKREVMRSSVRCFSDRRTITPCVGSERNE